MASPNHGGPRPGAGRPSLPKFQAARGAYLILERETIGGEIHKPELAQVLSIGKKEIELQIGNDLVVLRFPENGEIAIA